MDQLNQYYYGLNQSLKTHTSFKELTETEFKNKRIEDLPLKRFGHMKNRSIIKTHLM